MARRWTVIAAAAMLGLGSPGASAWPTSDTMLSIDLPHAYVDGNAGSRIVFVDATGARRIFEQPDEMRYRSGLVFSPDGDTIAYEAEPDGAVDPVIHLLDPYRDERSQLLVEGRGPSWSRSGTELAYSRPDGALAVIDPATGDERIVAPGSDPREPDAETPRVHRYHGCPTWSPDDSLIAVFYQSFYEGGDGFEGSRNELRVHRADGSGLVGAVAGVSCPTWAPDGTRFAYVAAGIRSARPDGSDPREVAPVGCGGAWWPRWTDRGVLFHRAIRQTDFGNLSESVIDSACTEERWNGTWLAADDGTIHRVVAHDYCCGHPSPDGEIVTYTVFRQIDRNRWSGQTWATDFAGNTVKLTRDSEFATEVAVAPPRLPSTPAPAPSTGSSDGRADERPAIAPAETAESDTTRAEPVAIEADPDRAALEVVSSPGTSPRGDGASRVPWLLLPVAAAIAAVMSWWRRRTRAPRP